MNVAGDDPVYVFAAIPVLVPINPLPPSAIDAVEEVAPGVWTHDTVTEVGEFSVILMVGAAGGLTIAGTTIVVEATGERKVPAFVVCAWTISV